MLEDAHPLAEDLVRLRSPGDRVLVLGIGCGRHLPPLLRAGLRIDAVEADPERREAASRRFADEIERGTFRVRASPDALDEAGRGELARALLSTHALLHGTPDEIAASLAAATSRLAPSADLFVTLGSRRDPRFGRGRRIDAATWAPEAGAEAGVPHAFFDRDGARALLAAFRIDSLEERSAAGTAGRWAHDAGEAATIVHWFVRARRRDEGGPS